MILYYISLYLESFFPETENKKKKKKNETNDQTLFNVHEVLNCESFQSLFDLNRCFKTNQPNGLKWIINCN